MGNTNPIGQPARYDIEFYGDLRELQVHYIGMNLTGGQARTRWRVYGSAEEWGTSFPNTLTTGQPSAVDSAVIDFADITNFDTSSRDAPFAYDHQIMVLGGEWRSVLRGKVWLEDGLQGGSYANYQTVQITVGASGEILQLQGINQGPQGPRGLSQLNGTSVPSSGLGVVGDVYLQFDLITGEPIAYFGPKTGSGWGTAKTVPNNIAETARVAAETVRVANEAERVIGERNRERNRPRTALREPAFTVARIVDGGADEGTPAMSNGATAVKNTASGYSPGLNGWEITVPNAGGSVFELAFSTPRNIGKAQMIQMVCDTVAGAGNVTSVALQIWQDGTDTQLWNRTFYTGAPNGMSRIQSRVGNVTQFWGAVHKIRVTFVTTGAATFRLRRIVGEVKKSPEAYIIFDGPYENAFTSGLYQGFADRGFPVHFACTVSLLGTGVAPNRFATVEFLRNLVENGGNGDIMSIHSWGGNPINAVMTAAEMTQENKLLAAWFAANGFDMPLIRDAFLQNNAPQSAAAQPFYAMLPFSSGSGGLDTWPPENKWSIPRIGIAGPAAVAQYMTLMDTLGKTNSLGVFYAHGVDAAGGLLHMTPSEVTAWFVALDYAIATYGLKGVNQRQLLERIGTRVEITPRGDRVLVESDELGNQTRRLLYT